MNPTKLSQYLSYVLRHRPDDLGIELDEEGFTDAAVLVSKMAARYDGFDMSTLEAIVREDNKGRYALIDGRIRANQGHSVPDVTPFRLEAIEPPQLLFHGTTEANWNKIRQSGAIERMARHHVHLSEEVTTAERVGNRRAGPTLVLEVDALRMHEDGHAFYRSENSVWLVSRVPIEYVRLRSS